MADGVQEGAHSLIASVNVAILRMLRKRAGEKGKKNQCGRDRWKRLKDEHEHEEKRKNN